MSERLLPSLELRKFDPRTMPDNASCVIVAESQGGKTTLGIDLMSYKKHLPAWVLFSTSEGCSQRLSNTIPPSYTFPTFDLKVLEKVYNHQESKIKKYTRDRTEEERAKIPDDELPLKKRFVKNPCVGMYFEDCFSDSKVFSKPIVQDLFKNGRHRMLFTIMPCQYVMNLPIACRAQVKYWFILREDRPKIRKKLFTEIGGACRTEDIFNTIMDNCTSNYGCVVIDNLCKSPRIEDRVFWYRAKLHQPFKVGCKRYWKYHKTNYDDKKKDDLDPAEKEARLLLGRGRIGKKRRSMQNQYKCMDSQATQSQLHHRQKGCDLLTRPYQRPDLYQPSTIDDIIRGQNSTKQPKFKVTMCD